MSSPLQPFHPTIARWFADRLGEPTAPQQRGWPAIRSGAHVLIAAPTGTGKTLAAFLWALDSLAREGAELADETRVLYISPLKALGNDVQKNLQGPLEELRALDPSFPPIRVLVRSGDTPASERAKMLRRPPHVLVTTPESVYILLTSDGGRAMLKGVRTVIVDEIHAVLGDKRGSHLALSLERLEALVASSGGAPPQRIGLSATQKPLEDVGRFLVGADRECVLVDEGHRRAMDLAVEIPPSPLETVCSHETWSEIYARVAALVVEHRTTLVFVGTRKMAERVSAQLTKLLGEAAVGCHHSSLSKERRLDAEQRLKAGKLRALVATASLELGIDVGDVDLAIQIGTPRSIAAFLQRVGRSGHGVGRTPKGRLFPLTRDELVEAAALHRALRLGILDRTPQPAAPLDILAQQVVAACVSETWSEDELWATLRKAWPYRELPRENFDAVLAMHADGRRALLHRDGVNRRVRATRRARLVAITSGGAIPDTTQYRVLQEPEGTFVGTVDEDFAIESSEGDVFQLGNASWRVLRVGSGTMRVADAHGAPPSLPFWVAEAPARTVELSEEVGIVREHGVDALWLERECGVDAAVAREIALYLEEARLALGAVPTRSRLVLERFFDESGGAQLVLHSTNGGRINRALGLALRRRFCRRFGFELQAAANEDAVVISLSPQHSFPLEEVFDYLRADTVEELLVQAALVTPMFAARWRWNVSRALMLEKLQGGKPLAPQIRRMRADDLLAACFPAAAACGETLPPGDLEIPDHPIVRQTVEDCLRGAMDVDGLAELLRGLHDGSIERVAVDLPAPSPFARSVLTMRPYGFLDDAPLEERRTQAVQSRRTLGARSADEIGALDPEAVARVKEEAWPDPRDAEEVHEALLWMGFVADAEVGTWRAWLEGLRAAGRVVLEGDRWFATEASRDPKTVLRGRMEALGPVFSDDPLLNELENEGSILRTRLDGREAWCDRRLLARIHRYTLDRLRREIEPVSAADFLRFLAAWQHVADGHRLEGPQGVREALRQLAGFEAPAVTWERRILAPRVKGYRSEWLDQVALAGEIAWARISAGGRTSPRRTPIAFFPREEMDVWLALAAPVEPPELSWPAARIRDVLASRGALFHGELERAADLLPSDAERGLAELIALGLVTSDSFASLRGLLRPAWQRKEPALGAGRWCLLRREAGSPDAEFVARTLLRRWGVIFRALLERERVPVPWREIARACRILELRGDVRGGRFVAGFSGEQFALPEAVPFLRKIRKEEPRAPLTVSAADPLNLAGVLTPGERVPTTRMRAVFVPA
ncbi:MAG: DEAD/DEAH box helicase [Planctomycetota bacterium]